MKTIDIAIAQVKVSGRVRKDHGDLGELKMSLEDIGMLQPIVLNSRKELVAGGRRLAAATELGWESVPAVVAKELNDAIAALKAEHDENVCRKPLTPSEMVEVGRRMEELEKPKAAERKATTQAKKGEKVGAAQGGAESAPPKNKGKTRDKVANALGTSADTYSKAKQVVEAAEKEPEKFGDLPAKMDSESVNAAHKEMGERKKESGKAIADAYGIPIQKHAAEAWQAVPAFRDLIRKIRELQREYGALAELPGGVWLQKGGRSAWRQDRSKPGSKESTGRFVSLALDQCVKDLEDAIPTYSVCPWQHADKPHPKDCSSCKGLNWTPPLLTGVVSDVILQRVKEAYGNV